MKKSLLLGLTIAFAILAGCSNNTDPAANTATNKPSDQAQVTESPTKEADPTPEPTKEPEKKLSADEQLALDYVNIFINGDDVETIQKFVEENIHEESLPLYSMLVSVSSDADKIQNPTVIGSSDYALPEAKAHITLVEGQDGKEIIVLTLDKKVVFAYTADATDENSKKEFTEMLALIK